MKVDVIASGSDGNCYMVYNDDTVIMIEAGISLRKLEAYLYGNRQRVYDISSCLLSHEHLDHSRTIKAILEVGIPCYMHSDTARAIGVHGNRKVAKFDFSSMDNGKNLPALILPRMVVCPFPVSHDEGVMCSGFIIRSDKEQLVYMTDYASSKYRFSGTTHYVIGCNYDEEIIRDVELDVAQAIRIANSHPSLQMVKRMLLSNDLSTLQEVHLIHVSDRHADKQKMHREIAEIVGIPVYIY